MIDRGIYFNRAVHPSDFAGEKLTTYALRELRATAEEWAGMNRKFWEWAMVLAAIDEFGYMRSDVTALGVASGFEAPVFSLTNHLHSVVASDLYGLTAFSGHEANTRMLRDPSECWPHPFERTRLLVMNADATSLPFGDDSFDVLFSCSSIEHFGSDESIKKHMAEAHRVMRPGGMYALSVDYMYRTPQSGRPRRRRHRAVQDFLTREDVQALLVDAEGFTLRDEVHYEVPEHLVTNLYDLETGLPESGEILPHLWLRWRDHYVTSLFLTLFK